MANVDYSRIIQDIVGRGQVAPRLGTTNPENLELAANIRRQLAEIGEQESILDKGLNVLGRTFDVLSRPLYGVAEAYREIAETSGEGGSIFETLREAGEGIVGGLAGKDKTTFSDVLSEAGVENNLIRGIGGFALDVVGDPLSYVGVGLARQAGEEVISKIAGRAFTEATAEAAVKGSAPRILAETAAVHARREAIQQGTTDPKILQKIAEQADQDYVFEHATKVSDLARNTYKEENPGELLFRFMGKEVGRSKSLYHVGKATANAVRRTKTGNAINKAFRPTATFVGRSNAIKRINESVGMAHAERVGAVIAKGGKIGEIDIPAFKNLTDDEAKLITHALESGDDLASHGLTNYVEAARKILDTFFDSEAGTFIDPNLVMRTADDHLDNYVPHYFDNSLDDTAAIADHKRLRKKDLRNQAKIIQDTSEKAAIKAAAAAKKDTTGKSAYAWDARQAAKSSGITDKAELDKIARKAEDNYPLVKAQEAFNEVQSTQKKITNQTLEAAKLRGLHPEEDIRTILGNRVLEHTKRVGRIKFLNGIYKEFGVNLGVGGGAEKTARRLGLIKADNKFLAEGVYFPKEIAQAIKRMDDVFYNDPAAGAALRDLYDSALSKLKFLQTVANPGHHVRNAISDISLNFLDGVTDPEVYEFSARILDRIRRSDRVLDIDLNDVLENLEDLTIPVGGLDFDGAQIYQWFTDSGAKSGYYRSEIIQKPGGVMERVRELSEYREDWTRLAHFIDAFRKEGSHLKSGASLDQIQRAAEKAGARVRKFNIDYGDLTPFEQRTMRRVIPFYTWMRKNIPLQIENLFMRPGRQVVTPKFIKNLQTAMGQSPEDMDILGLNALPDYMHHAMHVNLIGEGEGRNGVYWNPGSVFPLMDLNEFFGSGSLRDITERQLSGLTPFAQVPIQQITGYDFYTGRPHNRSLLENIVNLAPYGRYSQGVLTGEQPVAGTRLTNLLTGAGLTSLNEGMQRGELRRQEDIVQAIARRRREQLESLATGG